MTCERRIAQQTKALCRVTIRFPLSSNAEMAIAYRSRGFVTRRTIAKTEVMRLVVICVTKPMSSAAGTEDAFHSPLCVMRITTVVTEAMKRFVARCTVDGAR